MLIMHIILFSLLHENCDCTGSGLMCCGQHPVLVKKEMSFKGSEFLKFLTFTCFFTRVI